MAIITVVGAILTLGPVLVAEAETQPGSGASPAAGQHVAPHTGATALSPEAQHAKDAGADAEGVARIDAQTAPTRISEEIDAEIGRLPGLWSIEIDVKHSRVTVRARPDWAADVQSRLDRIAADAAAASIDVRFVDVPFGEDELTQIWDDIVVAAGERGVRINSGGGHVTEGTLSFAGPDLVGDPAAQMVLSQLAKERVGSLLRVVVEDEGAPVFRASDALAP